jgi:hypothetical protein
VLRAKELALTPSPSIVFTFGFIVESIKELGGASHDLFEHLQHKLGLKKRLGIKVSIVGGMPHIVENIPMKATTLLWTLP